MFFYDVQSIEKYQLFFLISENKLPLIICSLMQIIILAYSPLALLIEYLKILSLKN